MSLVGLPALNAGKHVVATFGIDHLPARHGARAQQGRRCLRLERHIGTRFHNHLYEVLEHRTARWTPALDEAIAIYEAALDAYVAGDWATAQDGFASSLRLRGDDKAAQLMVERCRRYRDDPPPDHPRGAFPHCE